MGFAIGTGTDVAIEASDITLIRGSLWGVVTAIEVSRATMRNIKQNLFGAFIYNSLGLPVAAGVLYPFFGILLSPVIAGWYKPVLDFLLRWPESLLCLGAVGEAVLGGLWLTYMARKEARSDVR